MHALIDKCNIKLHEGWGHAVMFEHLLGKVKIDGGSLESGGCYDHDRRR